MHRLFCGARVTITTTGMNEYWDFHNMFLYLIDFVILLGTQDCYLFASNCFGHWSKVYKRISVQEFDINMHLAGAATRRSTIFHFSHPCLWSLSASREESFTLHMFEYLVWEGVSNLVAHSCTICVPP